MSRMNRYDWYSRQSCRRSKSGSQYDRRLRVETLEDRRMLATFSVTNLTDGPVAAAGQLPGSLRQAIFDSNANGTNDTINFAAGSGTITLTNGDLAITDTADLTINGPGADQLIIDANNASRVFSIDDSGGGTNNTERNVSISGLTLINGTGTGSVNNGRGGAIVSFENLTLTAVAVTNNAVTVDGGGIWGRYGSLTINDSTVSGNAGVFKGGGIYSRDNAFNATNSTFSGNTVNNGGGIYLTNSTATLNHSTLSHNTANTSGGALGMSGGSTSVTNTILANSNVSADVVGTITANYSLIENTTGATILGANNITGSDPLLAVLAYNGGPTKTHGFLAGSLAINAGDPGFSTPPNFDQRGSGFAREALGQIDIGAFELQAAISAPEANISFHTIEILEKDPDPILSDFGKSLQLDGNNDYVDLTAGEAQFDLLTDGLTIEAWVKVDQFDIDSQTIVSKGDLWGLSRNASTDQVQFNLAGFNANSTTEIADGNWHHVAGVWSGVGPFSTVQILVDGQLEDTVVVNFMSGLLPNDVTALIGNNGAHLGRLFEGEIDEVRIWDTARAIPPTMEITLAGDEAGLVAYYNFDDQTATDQTSNNLDGTLIGAPLFGSHKPRNHVGYFEVTLSSAVDVSPGIILQYDIDGSSTAVQGAGADFYSAQLDLSTVAPPPAGNAIFIAEGETSGRIYVSALPDSVDESDEVVTINLLPDTDPFQIGSSSYLVGSTNSESMQIRDGDTHTAGIAATNTFGEDATVHGLNAAPDGAASLWVKLTSQPTDPVTVNLSRAPTVGSLNTSSLSFTTSDWNVPQEIVISGLAGLISDNDIVDIITTITLDPVSSDPAYDNPDRTVWVFDSSNTVKVKADEGQTTQTIKPTLSVRTTNDAIEGQIASGVFTFSLDFPAPETGLDVFFSLTDESKQDVEYTIFQEDLVAPNKRKVSFAPGATSVSVLIDAIDDDLADGDFSVEANIVADAAYTTGSPASATMGVLDNEVAGLEMATLTNIASLDTIFDTGVVIDDLFDIDVTAFNETASGTDVTISVALKELPSNTVVLTLSDANSAATQQLSFGIGDYDTPQDAVLTLAEAAATGLALVATTNANGDSNYNSLDLDLPFRRVDTLINLGTFLSTSEDGDDFTFAVRLTSQPTTAVTVDLLSSDATEGALNTSLNFSTSNWNEYQVVTVAGQNDAEDDGDQPYQVSLSVSVGDATYLAVTDSLNLTNQDNNDQVVPTGDTSNESDIIATLKPLPHTMDETGMPGQFQITLSAPAPTGGLDVRYSIFEDSATTADIDIENFIEQFGDSNPLALSFLDLPEDFVPPASISLGDLDNDGDFDALLSLFNGITKYYKNIGTPGLPEFEDNATENPLGAFNGNASAMGDVDGDGDLDVIQVQSSTGPIDYLENQLVGSGTLSFIQRTGASNPFDGLTLFGTDHLSLVDIDDDGKLELFITDVNSNPVKFFENVAGSYVSDPGSPLTGIAQGGGNSLHFTDWDGDHDQDLFVGIGSEIKYYENIGNSAAASFVERTGDQNPVAGITFDSTTRPFLVDIDNNGQLDLFSSEFTIIGEVASTTEVRYFEAAQFQVAQFAAGESSKIVNIPVVDDQIDEPAESFDVALISQISQTLNLKATANFDDQYTIDVINAYNGSTVDLQIDLSTSENIINSALVAGTVLAFSGGTTVTVDADTTIDSVDFVNVPVTPTIGTTILAGETTTATYDTVVALEVTTGFGGGEIGLWLKDFESFPEYTLPAGLQLTFSGSGTVLEVDEDTRVNHLNETLVPVSLISGATVASSETADMTAIVGEVTLVVDEVDTEFIGLPVGTMLDFDNGAVFDVGEPELVFNTLGGDYDGSGVVDSNDLAVWELQYGQTGIGLTADGNGDGVVDGKDFLLWQTQLGQADPESTGVVVAGVLLSGSPIPSDAKATFTTPGYRNEVNLKATSTLAGGNVSLQINDPSFSAFTLKAGQILEFGGGASVIVDSDTAINDVSGTSVAVTLASNTSSSNIAVDEATATSDFFVGVDIIVTGDGVGDFFLGLKIDDPSISSFLLKDQTILTFSGGAIITVNGDTLLNNATGIDIQFGFTPESPVQDPTLIVTGQTSQTVDFESVSSTQLTIVDNDTADLVLTTPDGTTTTEAGGSKTIHAVLATEPTADVTVYLGINNDEALLSYGGQIDQTVVSLTFTPNDWMTPQIVTVTGIDDLVDEEVNNTPFTVTNTVVSTDYHYQTATVSISPFADFDNLTTITDARFVLDEVSFLETFVEKLTFWSFTNGARLQVGLSDFSLSNSFPVETGIDGMEDVDTISLNDTATVYHDGAVDDRTNLEVTTGFVPTVGNNGTVSLRIETSETNITSVTLAAGKVLRFDNGTIARITSDATLDNVTGVSVAVELTEGTAISTSETSFFEENLFVSTPYDGASLIGLQVDDALIKSITFASGTDLSFSNGAVAALDSGEVITNSSESSVAITVDPLRITTKATAHLEQILADDLSFTNTDDDGAGISVTQTDHAVAITEGFSNNFFSVKLNTQPIAPVEITLSPTAFDPNIKLEAALPGESIAIEFDETNWDVEQTIEVFAVDDSLLEYDTISTIDFAVSSADPEYDTVSLPNSVKVFIQDDELPLASVETVAGAIEANAPGYFVVMLDNAAPSGHDDTGIVVNYTVSGTADTDGAGETDDLQSLSGTALIAPGETTSQLIAFPIDDFKTEGIDLAVAANYDELDASISLKIDVEPFQVGAGGYNALEETVDLTLDIAPSGKTTILAQGTTLLFNNSTEGTVTKTTIVPQGSSIAVPITLSGNPADASVGSAVYQEITVATGTKLKFADGAVVQLDETKDVSNEAGTLVLASLVAGGTISLTAGSDDAKTTLQGESVTVTIDAGAGYDIGDANAASLNILDNDKPGIRVVEKGSATRVVEGEVGGEFFISLLSQPASNVTVTLANDPTDRQIEARGNYLVSDTLISLQLKDPNNQVESLLLPVGDYTFGGTNVHVDTATTIFADQSADVPVTLTGGGLAMGDTGDYSYGELSFVGGSNSLTFTPDNWFQLQTVTVLGTDDNVVEQNDFHVSDLQYTVTSTDPNYSDFTVPDQSIEIVDRRFDKENTFKSVSQGFLALQDSINNITLPILGKFGDVAPPFIETFLEDLADEIRGQDDVTAETLRESFNTAINNALSVDTFSIEVTDISSSNLSFLLSFTDNIDESIELNSDLGLDALNIGIETEGSLDLNVDFDVSFAFGIDTDDGFYIDTDETALSLVASLAFSEMFSATGELGFIQLDLVNGTTDGTGIGASFVVTLEDTVNMDGKLTLGELNTLRGSNDPFSFINYGFSGGATLDLDVTTSIEGNSSFPSFSFNLYSDLPLFNYGNESEAAADTAATLTVGANFNQLEGAIADLMLSTAAAVKLAKGTELDFNGDKVIVHKTISLATGPAVAVKVKVVDDGVGVPSAVAINSLETATLVTGDFNLAFNDLTLDLGGFVTDLLGPVITSINDIVEPFKPVIDVLTTEVELLEKLGLAGVFDQDDDGKATLIEIALTLAGGVKNGKTQAKFVKFINAVTTIIELTESLSDLENSIAGGGSLAIDFGSYELQGFKGASSDENEDATNVDPTTGGNGAGLDMNASSQTGTSGNSKVSKFFGKLGDLGITLDVIENPFSVISFLLGQDIDLVTWDVPVLDLNFKIEQEFPIVLGIKGVLGGEFSVYADLVFGFDTAGLSQWKEKDFAIEDAYLIFDGFYLSDVDPITNEDVDELTFEATISAGVEASAVIASIRATGGITGTAGLDLIDIGEREGTSDGRIRGSEIISRINRPLELFQLSGKVEAFANIVVSIGIDLGFWSIEKEVFRKELVRITLFEFTIGGGGGGAPLSSNVVSTLDPDPSSGVQAPASQTATAAAVAQSAPLALLHTPESTPATVVESASPAITLASQQPVIFDTNQSATGPATDLFQAVDVIRAAAAIETSNLHGLRNGDFSSLDTHDETSDRRTAWEMVFSDWNLVHGNSFSLAPRGTGVRMDGRRSDLEQSDLYETLFDNAQEGYQDEHDSFFSELEETTVELL